MRDAQIGLLIATPLILAFRSASLSKGRLAIERDNHRRRSIHRNRTCAVLLALSRLGSANADRIAFSTRATASYDAGGDRVTRRD